MLLPLYLLGLSLLLLLILLLVLLLNILALVLMAMLVLVMLAGDTTPAASGLPACSSYQGKSATTSPRGGNYLRQRGLGPSVVLRVRVV